MEIIAENLTKSFGDQVVLQDVTFRLPDLKALVLIGPSGGGKSTLLRILAGLESPGSGSVRINGETVRCDRAWRRSVGVVFQGFNLFPHLTAEANITLPLREVHGLQEAEAKAAAYEVLARFQLEAHANKHPAQLSGGQKQRIAIARAVAFRPRLLLFDEPTSALDPEMTAEVLDLIQELKKAGHDLVLVTHQMGFAREVADQLAFLAEGTILELGSPAQVFDASRTVQCRDFLSRVLRY